MTMLMAPFAAVLSGPIAGDAAVARRSGGRRAPPRGRRGGAPRRQRPQPDAEVAAAGGALEVARRPPTLCGERAGTAAARSDRP